MRLSLAFIFLFCFAYSDAQLPANIKFTNYTRANGLQEEIINNIVEDSRGLLWIGSKEGLIRFDGHRFKTWYADPTNPSKFNNNSIMVVGECLPGYIFFLSGAQLWKINIFNHQFSQVSQFSSKTILSNPTRLSNGFWSLTDADSVYIVDKTFHVAHTIPLNKFFHPNTWVGSFYLQHPYALLYSNSRQECCLFNYISKQITPLDIDATGLDSRSKWLRPLAYDSTIHRLYLSAYFNGNFYIDLQLDGKTKYQPIFMPGVKDGSIRTSKFLPGNKLIQGGEGGLFITDFNNTYAFNTRTKMDKPLLSDVIVDICKASDGSYWLSTTNGISRFTLDQPLIKYWKTELSLSPTDEFKTILKAADGNIYFMTKDKSLLRMNKATASVQRLDSSVFYCWSATQSGDEITITGAGKKLAIYNTKTNKIKYPAFLDSFYNHNTDLVTLAFTAKNGDRWYSCNGSVGLIRNPAGTNQYIHYSRNSSPPSFSHTYVLAAAEDSDGNIWWGSNKTQMLLKWDQAAQKFYEYGVDKLIPQNNLKTGINNLFVDAKDNLWIAMDGAALLKYNIKNKTGGYYDINQGLPTNAVNGMCNDAKGRLWFGTPKGLCCYLPEKDKIITFTANDGLPEDNIEGNGLFYDKEENILYVGARQSLAFFNPDSLLSATMNQVSPVFIDEMLVNGHLFYFDDRKNIKLQTKQNNIEFAFTSPDFNRNNQLIFQYQLKGASNDWIDIGEKRSVTFNNLAHGHYTLSVRSKYKGTETWKETDHPFSFTIKTPFLKTIWFRLIVVTIAALLVWFIIRSYYKQKLEREKSVLEKQQAIEKERTRIATDMHDDFGASLSRIKFLSEKLQLYKPGNTSETTDLQKISLYSDEMSEKMNEIVWALNQRYDSLEDLVSFSRSYASEYLQDKNIKLHFSTEGITEKKIQGETRRNIFLVIKEALHNIVKHAGATEVNIAFAYIKDLHVSIADNGKGFDEKNIHAFANGLENMKKRIADINGDITITSENGTRIRISAPI